MKKVIIGILILNFLSCSQDDNDNSGESTKSIVGLWSRTKLETISGDDKTTILETETPLDDCERKTFFEFTLDEKYNYATYYTNNNECTLDDSGNINYKFNSTSNTLTLINLDGSERGNGDVEFTDEGIILIGIGDDANDDGIDDIYRHYLVK